MEHIEDQGADGLTALGASYLKTHVHIRQCTRALQHGLLVLTTPHGKV